MYRLPAITGWFVILILIFMGASPARADGADEARLTAVNALLASLSGDEPRFASLLSSESPHGDSDPSIVFPGKPSTWSLQTIGRPEVVAFHVEHHDGLDEFVTLEMVEEAGEWKLREVSSSRRSPGADDLFDEPALDSAPGLGTIGLSTAVAGLVLVLIGFAVGISRNVVQLVGGLLLIAGAAVFLIDARNVPAVRSPGEQDDPVPLPRLEDVEAALEARRIDEAVVLLSELPPSAENDIQRTLITARVAAANDDASSSLVAYDHAIRIAPHLEQIRIEAARAAWIYGELERARKYLESLEEAGSDNPVPYYFRINLSQPSTEADWNDLEERMLRAMSLEPASRASLFQSPALTYMSRRPTIASRLRLWEIEEPRWQEESRAEPQLDLPRGWNAYRSGKALALTGPSGTRVHLWGLGPHEPERTVRLDPLAWERLERDRVLAGLEGIDRLAASASSWLQPGPSRELSIAVTHLGTRYDWDAVERLTRNLPGELDRIETGVITLRAQSLANLDREEDAHDFVAKAAVAELKNSNPDPLRLASLGQMMASLERYTTAIRLMEKAIAIRSDLGLGDKVREYSMIQRLENDYETHETKHFTIRYPRDAARTRPIRVGEILESELSRITEKLGVSPPPKTVVRLLKWHEFRSLLTHSDYILGFYDGEITFPLAGIPVFPEEVIALLSHELTHAIVGHATTDRAPRWFQEGMATRMEMMPQRNAFTRYDQKGILPLTLLDPVLSSARDPERMLQAYVISHTWIRYLEEVLGSAGLRRLIERFGEGTPTEEALPEILGKSILEIERDFRAWGRATERSFLPADVIRYDETSRSEIIRFSNR